MEERLQKILSAYGLCARREAEKWILAGRVCVNGRVAALGDKADPETDEITIDGQPLARKPDYVYLMLNKPRGVVTTLSDEKGRRNAAFLVAGCGARVVPVGRLDMDSEGLLLFTNDGSLVQRLTHPGKEVNKVYNVWVAKYTPEKTALLRRPVTLDGYTIRPPEVKVLEASGGTARLEVVIHEGRNRQIRRMCQMAGLDVTRLQRVAEGTLTLGSLPVGRWRYLTEEEIRLLKES